MLEKFFQFPIAGFLDGLMDCYECNGAFGLLERVMKGFVGAITSTIILGNPYYNEGGVGGTNTHTSVLITAIILSLLLFLLVRFSKIKSINKTALNNGLLLSSHYRLV